MLGKQLGKHMMSACVEMMRGSIVAVVSNSREHKEETNSTGPRTENSTGPRTEIFVDKHNEIMPGSLKKSRCGSK